LLSCTIAALSGAELHRTGWDGTDNGGTPVSSAVYFVRLRTRNIIETRKAGPRSLADVRESVQ
jgi:hypothetical protein